MANTKLSNTYGLDRVVKSIPSQIKSYTNSVSEDVSGTKEKSLYYSEMTFIGMLTCIVLCVVGASLLIVPNIIFEYLSIDKNVLETCNILIRLAGGLLVLVGIHGIGKMVFAKKITSCGKGVSKIEGLFIKQFETSIEKYSVNQMIYNIENCKDEELPDSDALDRKLVNSVESLYARNKLMNKFTMISRIVLPIILYILVLFVTFKVDKLGIFGAVTAFTIMIIFSRRVCLLLEYKVGTIIRIIMAIPAIVYGVLFYIKARDVFGDLQFLPYNIYMKAPDGAKMFVSSLFIVCLIQVIALVLSVLFQDYYSEKKRLFEGVKLNYKGEAKHKRWYIYYNIVLHIVLFIAYIVALFSEMSEIRSLNSVGFTSLSVGFTSIIGVIFGVIWRVISPIWPERISKTIREFLGAKYSVIVAVFVFVMVATLFLLSGFIFTGYALTALIAMIVGSWIAFAVMVHFWG